MVDQVDGAEVKLGADAAPAKSGMEDAQASIADSLGKISDALQKFSSSNQRTVDQAVKSHNDLSRSFLGLHETIVAKLGSINSAYLRFRDSLASIAGLLGGGLLFKSSIDSLLRMEDEVRSLSVIFGISAEKASLLATNLRLAGVSAETFEMMAQRVGMRIRLQADEFDRLGVKIKDASGNLLPMEDILQNVYHRMLDFKAGTDQTLFALSTVGRNAKDFASDMERVNATTLRAAQLQRELGIEWSADKVARVEKYRIEVNAFKVVLEEIGESIGETVLPRLESMARWFQDRGPTAIKYFMTAVKGLIVELEALGALVTSVAIVFDVLTTKPENLLAAMKRAGPEIMKVWDDATARVNALLGSTDALINKMGSISGRTAEDRGAGARGGKGTETFVPRPAGGLPSLVEQWRQQLEQIKDQQGLFNEFSKAQEAAFWAEKLALVKKGSKDYIEVYHEMHAAQRADAREQLADAMAAFQLEIDAAKDNKDKQIGIAVARTATIKTIFGEESKEYKAVLDAEIKLRQDWQRRDEALVMDSVKHNVDMLSREQEGIKAGLDLAVGLRQISTEQQLAIEAGLENQIFEAKRAEYERELSLLTQGTLAYQQQAEKIEALEKDHQNNLTKIANQAVLEREKYAIQANDAITSSLSDTLAKLIDNTQNWKKTLLDAFKALDEQLVKIASNKLVEQMFGAGTAGGSFLSKLTGGIFGTGDTGQIAAQAANTSALAALTAAVTANTAAVSASSAASFGSSLFGGGGGFGFGSFAGGMGGFSFGSFDVGTPYVPRDMVAVVHKGEAVIPAAANKPGAYGATISQRNTFMLSGPVDTRTMTQIALEAQRATQRALRASR